MFLEKTKNRNSRPKGIYESNGTALYDAGVDKAFPSSYQIYNALPEDYSTISEKTLANKTGKSLIFIEATLTRLLEQKMAYVYCEGGITFAARRRH